MFTLIKRMGHRSIYLQSLVDEGAVTNQHSIETYSLTLENTLQDPISFLMQTVSIQRQI